MIIVAYSMEEIQALTRLLDVAAKAGGLAVAGDVAALHQKHVIAVQEATKPEPEEKNTEVKDA